MTPTRTRQRAPDTAPGRAEATPPGAAAPSPGRPVLLATLDVPFDQGAATVAVDAAVESGQPLIVVNVVELPPLPLSVILGYDDLEYTEEMEVSLRRPAQLAQSLGLRVERLRVKSPHPVEALLEVTSERGVGLLVFGPDRTRLGRLRFRRAVRSLRARATCLVWLPD
jgi:nucleotide-binding universal stress UspA family protein